MMRLILALKSIEGIKEKLLKLSDRKSGEKDLKKSENKKHCSSK
jgi:hypothetical protein